MPALKHRLKTALTGAWARLACHTPLGRIVDARTERRLLILYGHCVEDPDLNGELHADMKIGAAQLGGILKALGARFDLVTISEGMNRLRSGERGRSMVALSMDDGYRDNLLRLVPILETTGAKATIFLEAGAVANRRLPWLHAFGWLDAELGTELLAKKLAVVLPETRNALLECRNSNRLKRILKYDAERGARDRGLADLLDEHGGDARGMVDRLYLSVEEAQRLAAFGSIEIGGHTVDHPVLSRLSKAEQQAQISGGAKGIRLALGVEATGAVLAFPYGRAWDYDDASKEAAKEAGYTYAVTTHDGVNRRGTDPFALKRVPIHGDTRLHHLVAEATGCLDLFRRAKR